MPKTRGKTNYSIKDSPFFRLRTRRKLADLLHISETTLLRLTRRTDLYRRRWKHKRLDHWCNEKPSDDLAHLYRPIDIPDETLKKLQSRIAVLLGRIEPPDWLFSPVKGRSYVDNAARHKGANAFWLLDIENYFPSCTANNVAHFFRAVMECSPDVTAILVRVCTWSQCLPQGSPCSPILAYYSNLGMWLSIEKIVKEANLKHSLYADDLTISGNVVSKSVIWTIKQIIYKHGHKIKREKEVSLIGAPADITGVIIVGDQVKLPNRQLKRLFELRNERHRARSAALQRLLDRQIAGRLSQQKQVEGV